MTFLSRPRALGSHIYDGEIREMSEDVRSLVEHNAFLFQKVRFLLDTTSGFINAEQNDTIRRFSILPSMLAPPMLVTSLYGMNTTVLPFAHGDLKPQPSLSLSLHHLLFQLLISAEKWI